MKTTLTKLFAIFIGAGFAQTNPDSLQLQKSDSSIIGKYSFVEQKGYPLKPGEIIGSAHLIAFVFDTTIEYSLLIDSNYHSSLEIDTTIGTLKGSKPKLKWYGKWEIINDTLLITFTEVTTLWPISVNGETPTPTIEKMTSPIIFEFLIKTNENHIYGLELVNDEETTVYTFTSTIHKQ